MKSPNHSTLPKNVLEAIGNTPLVKLEQFYKDAPIRVFAKLELVNPGGSIKDRTAHNILTKAIDEGRIERGHTIIESSSGNMAIGLAQACLYHGLKLIVVVDPKLNFQTCKILKALRAKLVYVRSPDPGGSYLNARLEKVQQLLNEVSDSYWPNQYANPANPQAHEKTMKEIVSALHIAPDYLFAAVSTCGTLMGCAEYVKKHRLPTKIIGVDAHGSVIFGQPPGQRLIPGHGAGRPSQFLDPGYVDNVVHITDRECVEGCHLLLQQEAILAGGSSGANVMALKKFLPFIPAKATCVMLFCDRGERYLDTIYDPRWVNRHFPFQDSSQFYRNTIKAPTQAYSASNTQI